MAIELGGGWFLYADTYCYMLGTKRAKPTTKGGWFKWEYFFPTLEKALEHFAGLQERAEIACRDGAVTPELLSAVNHAHEETRALIQACAAHFPELPV